MPHCTAGLWHLAGLEQMFQALGLHTCTHTHTHTPRVWLLRQAPHLAFQFQFSGWSPTLNSRLPGQHPETLPSAPQYPPGVGGGITEPGHPCPQHWAGVLLCVDKVLTNPSMMPAKLTLITLCWDSLAIKTHIQLTAILSDLCTRPTTPVPNTTPLGTSASARPLLQSPASPQPKSLGTQPSASRKGEGQEGEEAPVHLTVQASLSCKHNTPTPMALDDPP